jgi:hypothetical protein
MDAAVDVPPPTGGELFSGGDHWSELARDLPEDFASAVITALARGGIPSRRRGRRGATSVFVPTRDLEEARFRLATVSFADAGGLDERGRMARRRTALAGVALVVAGALFLGGGAARGGSCPHHPAYVMGVRGGCLRLPDGKPQR